MSWLKVFGWLPFLWACGGQEATVDYSTGKGWSTVLMDTDIVLVPGEAPKVTTDLIVVLEQEASYGPTFILNSIGKTSTFGPFEVPDHEITLTTAAFRRGYSEYCHVRSETLYEKGDTLQISIPVTFRNSGNLLHYWSEDFAMASWVNVWYPTPIGAAIDASWARMKAPGHITYTLPEHWEVVSSGDRDTLYRDGDRKVSRWWLDGSVARSFAAGPFREISYETGAGQELSLVGTANIEGQQDRVDAFLRSIKELEELFGPAPYRYHSIVEVPREVPGFYGASEQNYILLKTQAFDDELSSLPVLAHEAAHAWWAISVGVELDGDGGLFMTEAMAQYSAVLAIEKVHGKEAAKEFLWSGEGGFSRNHDAQAFLRLVDQRRDVPLITKRLGSADQHYVADSKGAWVYHMLRRKMGDEAFFGAIREIVSSYQNKTISLAEWCAVFNQSTPLDLTRFFKQWLEWEGAPHLVVSYSKDRKGAIISQVQEEGVYELELELLIEYADGSKEKRLLPFDQRETSVTSANGVPIKVMEPDPEHDLLIFSSF